MSDDMLDLLFETTADYAIILLDPEGVIRRWNPGAERIFGFGADEVVGTEGRVIFVEPDQWAGVPELEFRTAREFGRADDERWHMRRDGSRFWGSGVMIALRRGDRTVGYAKILRDHTDRRHLEDVLRRAVFGVPSMPAPPIPSRTEKAFVLVADDEPGIRTLVQRTIEDLGYTVVSAEHGGQAVEIVERVGLDVGLVVLDISMPVLDGVEAASIIQAHRSDIPIILMSGQAEDAVRRRFEKLGIAEFVAKPFTPDQMTLAVRRALGLSVSPDKPSAG